VGSVKCPRFDSDNQHTNENHAGHLNDGKLKERVSEYLFISDLCFQSLRT
jgi:hypothetical protein